MPPRASRPLSLATALILSLGFCHGVAAQSSEGLKLGQPATQPSVEKLDLGAPAPADRPANVEPAAAPQAAPSTLNPPAAPAPGQGAGAAATQNVIGAWEVACPAEGRNCAMAQIGNDASGTPVLEMVVRKLPEPLEVGERTAIAVLDVITPLGVVLTEGLSVTIDGGRSESAPFQICTEQGCLVREPIDDGLVTRLKRGNSAVVSVIAANQGEVNATLSLSGFTKAYDSLK